MDKHVDQLVTQPTRHFDDPSEVLSYPGLKYRDRLRILESWKQDAQRLAESTAENMSGGEETDLLEVSQALLRLKSMEKPPRAIHHRNGQRPVATGMAIGGLLGAGAGLVAAAATTTLSLSLIAQASIVGLIAGGVAGALRSPQPKKEL
jgi:hypothetical protein